jgi:hypothetical protein
MRPAEVLSLQINNYELDPSNIQHGIKMAIPGIVQDIKRQESPPIPLYGEESKRARELLIWIQEAIKARILHDLVMMKIVILVMLEPLLNS